ncbi:MULTISPECIES: TonB-dependent receptor [unclassified Brevundimonas]|uniref:TonB-dependent receptor n=2 Tax=Brevundimonas TaxID=41275 RepID=UPI0025BCDD26|nr:MULTISPECIES: TonB-dependent receptor [unclassified Brevundimonas]
MGRTSFKAHLASTAGFAAILIAPTAMAQQSAPAAQLDDITVVGARAEALGIVTQKRRTDGIADFLSEDEAGQLPDLNIAESLRRIPGVTAIFDEDRGRFVTVRGLNANLNYVAIDGLGVATTDEFGGTGRKVNLEVIPSGAVGLLEVRKTFTPDIDGGAIGGFVDLHTRSAFKGRAPFIVAEGGLNLQTYQDVPNGNSGKGPIRSPVGGQFSVTYANRFGAAEQFGMVAAAHLSQDQRDESKNIQAGEAYYTAAGAKVDPILADGTVNPAWNGFVAPDQVRSYDYTNRVRDYGANLKLEYRTQQLYASVLGYYYAEGQQETRNAVQYLNMDRATNQTQDSGTLRLGQVRIGWNFNPLDRQNIGAILSSRYTFDNGRFLSLKAGWSYNDFDDLQPLVEFRGLPANRSVSYEVVERGPAVNRYAFADPVGLLNPARYTLNQYSVQSRHSDENVFDVKLDHGFNRDGARLGWGYQVGVELRRLDRRRDNNRTDYVSNSVALTDYAFQTDFQPGWLNVPLLWVDGPKFLRDVAPTLKVNAASTAEREIIEDYRYVEDTRAAYGLTTYTGPNYKFVGGLRYEDVGTEATTPGEVLADGFSKRKGGYDQLLPSATFAYDLASDLRLKLGASRSLGRPNPGDIAQRERRSDTNATISRGNPDLRPRVSTNLDVGLEYYLPNRNGLISAALFSKAIDDEIVTRKTEEIIDGVTYLVTQPQNAEGADVWGVELGVIANRLTFLPEQFQGFGVSGNLTYVNGRITYLDDDGQRVTSDRLVDQSRWFGNAALFYAGRNYEARVTYNHWGGYIDALTPQPWLAQGWDGFETIDLSVRYDLSRQWKLKFKARNLLNENRTRVRGLALSDLYEQVEFGQSFYLNLSYKY